MALTYPVTNVTISSQTAQAIAQTMVQPTLQTVIDGAVRVHNTTADAMAYLAAELEAHLATLREVRENLDFLAAMTVTQGEIIKQQNTMIETLTADLETARRECS